ncbi:hypothetical protein DSC45_29470 [Streptomyces sp. YIM 130001]|nr:hypothetical protein DSC45_29470 [Streptomyces sp. YIM 130001]
MGRSHRLLEMHVWWRTRMASQLGPIEIRRMRMGIRCLSAHCEVTVQYLSRVALAPLAHSGFGPGPGNSSGESNNLCRCRCRVLRTRRNSSSVLVSGAGLRVFQGAERRGAGARFHRIRSYAEGLNPPRTPPSRPLCVAAGRPLRGGVERVALPGIQGCRRAWPLSRPVPCPRSGRVACRRTAPGGRGRHRRTGAGVPRSARSAQVSRYRTGPRQPPCGMRTGGPSELRDVAQRAWCGRMRECVAGRQPVGAEARHRHPVLG